MCLQVLEDTSTLRERAEALLAGLVVELIAASALSTGTRMLRVERSVRSSPRAIEASVWLELLGVEIRRLATSLEML